ncbi:MAG: peptidyl-prolyl cis-trans isomerase [Rhodospirillaceae bacterium]|nr:peptidyl-prolyl cis-trans isomerase [Rhodospirillaceae bacterium]
MIQGFVHAIKHSKLLKAFLLLIIVSFGVWGVGDVVTPTADPNVAVKSGSFEIRATELQRRLTSQLDRLREQLGPDAVRDRAFQANVLDNLVAELRQLAVSIQAADDLGVVISREQILRAVRQDTSFHDETGAFNQLQFQQILGQNGLDEQTFLDIYEDGLRQEVLRRPVAVGATAPQALVEKLFAYRTETRIADTLLISAEQAPAPGEPSAEDLKRTYDDNIAQFTAPEYRKIEAVVLVGSDLVPLDSISEEDARQYFEENQARYGQPEKRRIAQLVFETKEAAEAARAMAVPGDGLAVIADKAKVDPPVDLGERPRDDALFQPFGAAVDGAVGEISQPVETPLGWHLVEVVAIVPASVPAFEQIANDIRRTLAEEKALDVVFDASVKLEDEVAAGMPMADIAKDVGGRFIAIEAVSREGLDPSGVTVPDLIDRERFLATAFSTPVDQESELREIDGGFYALRVVGSTPPTPKPIDLVRPELVSLWQRLARIEETKKLAEKIAADIGPSTSMTQLADADQRLSYAQLGPLTRFGVSLDPAYIIDSRRVGPELLDQLFAAKVGDVMTAPVVDGYVVARLKEVVPPAPSGELATALSEIKAGTRNAMAQDLLSQFDRAIAGRYQVAVNQETLDQLLGVTAP